MILHDGSALALRPGISEQDQRPVWYEDGAEWNPSQCVEGEEGYAMLLELTTMTGLVSYND